MEDGFWADVVYNKSLGIHFQFNIQGKFRCRCSAFLFRLVKENFQWQRMCLLTACPIHSLAILRIHSSFAIPVPLKSVAWKYMTYCFWCLLCSVNSSGRQSRCDLFRLLNNSVYRSILETLKCYLMWRSQLIHISNESGTFSVLL